MVAASATVCETDILCAFSLNTACSNLFGYTLFMLTLLVTCTRATKRNDCYNACGIILCLYSLSGETSYGKISRSLEVARWYNKCYGDRIASAAAEVPVKFQCDWKSPNRILRLRDFMRSCGKTSVRLVHRGPEGQSTSDSTRQSQQILNNVQHLGMLSESMQQGPG